MTLQARVVLLCGLWVVAAAATPGSARQFASMADLEPRVGPFMAGRADHLALLRQARRDGRVAVAYFRDPKTADGAPLEGAWASPTLLAWLEPHAIVWSGPLDVDSQLATEWGITTPDTVIVWAADGSELARGPSRQQPEAMLAFLAEARSLALSFYQSRREENLREEDAFRMHQGLCTTAVSWGQLDDATEEYKWLWQNIPSHAPSMSAVRGSFMTEDMRSLASRHAAARREFAALRDALDPNAMDDRESAADWALLNYIVGEDERTVRWFAGVNDADAGGMGSAELPIEGALIRQQEWQQAVRLHPRPVEETVRWLGLGRELGEVPGVPREAQRRFRATHAEATCHRIGTLYAIFLAAGLDERAADIAWAARKNGPRGTMEVVLVRAAANVSRVLPEHAQWIERAKDAGADVSEVEPLLRDQK